MNRAEFFKKLGLGVAAVVSAPTILAGIKEKKPFALQTERRKFRLKNPPDFKWLNEESIYDGFGYSSQWTNVELGKIQMREYKTPHGTLRMIGGQDGSML